MVNNMNTILYGGCCYGFILFRETRYKCVSIKGGMETEETLQGDVR